MENLKQIVDFIIAEGEGLYEEEDREDIARVVNLHDQYGTFMIVRDAKGVMAVARWNWADKETVHILDTIVRKDCRNRKNMKYLVALGKSKNPTAKKLTFERLHKYPGKAPVSYDMERFIGKRRTHHGWK